MFVEELIKIGQQRNSCTVERENSAEMFATSHIYELLCIPSRSHS